MAKKSVYLSVKDLSASMKVLITKIIQRQAKLKEEKILLKSKEAALKSKKDKIIDFLVKKDSPGIQYNGNVLFLRDSTSYPSFKEVLRDKLVVKYVPEKYLVYIARRYEKKKRHTGSSLIVADFNEE